MLRFLLFYDVTVFRFKRTKACEVKCVHPQSRNEIPDAAVKVKGHLSHGLLTHRRQLAVIDKAQRRHHKQLQVLVILHVLELPCL